MGKKYYRKYHRNYNENNADIKSRNILFHLKIITIFNLYCNATGSTCFNLKIYKYL